MNLSDLDLDSISRALDNHDPDQEHFLDLGDGSVWTFVVSESTDETRQRHREVVAGLGRTHARIPGLTAQQAFEEIEDFVEEMAEPTTREALFRALERRGAFRNFREALLQHPEEHRRWRSRRRESSRRRLAAFLQGLGLDPVAVSTASGDEP